MSAARYTFKLLVGWFAELVLPHSRTVRIAQPLPLPSIFSALQTP